MLLDSPQMPRGIIIATQISIDNFSIQESTTQCHSPQPKRENRPQSHLGTTLPSLASPLTPTRSYRQTSPFRLARQMDRPRHLRFLITTNPATSPRRMRFRTSLRSFIAIFPIWRPNFSLIRANLRMRTVSSLRVSHRPEPMKRRKRDGRA